LGEGNIDKKRLPFAGTKSHPGRVEGAGYTTPPRKKEEGGGRDIFVGAFPARDPSYCEGGKRGGGRKENSSRERGKTENSLKKIEKSIRTGNKKGALFPYRER